MNQTRCSVIAIRAGGNIIPSSRNLMHLAMAMKVKYGDLEQVLYSFGFTLTKTKEGYRVFRHPHSKAILLLPRYRRNQTAQLIHVAVVRSTLDDFGFLDRDEFDDVVRNHGRAAS